MNLSRVPRRPPGYPERRETLGGNHPYPSNPPLCPTHGESTRPTSAKISRIFVYEIQNMCYSEVFSLNGVLKESLDDRRQGARSAPPVGRAWQDVPATAHFRPAA